MTHRLLRLMLVLCSWAGAVSADIAFPARLDVVESEPGLYEITFTLPIVEGRKLRAQPVMPPTCTELGEREEGASSGGFTSSWSVQCEPSSLAGEAILVEGLLGTQTDLAFTLTTLDGRSYSQILRPSRPGFLVPQPPHVGGLALEAVVSGLRRTLRHIGLWLMFAVAAVAGGRTRYLMKSVGAFAVGHFLAQWMGGVGWLEVAPQMRDIVLWSTVAVPAIGLAAGGGWAGWLRPLWPTALLLGLLHGGARPDALPPEGLSTAEQFVALVVFSVGVGLAAFLMVAAARELVTISDLAGGGRWRQRFHATAGYVIGSIAVGLLVAQLVGVWVSPAAGLATSLPVLLLAAVLGPTLVYCACGDAKTVMAIAIMAATGMALGLAQNDWFALTTLTFGSLFFMGAALALNRPLSARWALAGVVAAVPANLWWTSSMLVENVSRSTAVTGGVALAAATVFWMSISIAPRLSENRLPVSVRVMGMVVAGAAVAWRIGEYRLWFEREVATETALGLARLPLLSAALVALAIIVWPRKKWDDGREGGDRGFASRHLVVVGAAFMLLPYGNVSVRNPFFEASAPRGEGARLIMSRVLTDTYHAFNIEDEAELYDALSQSVTGDLVGDIYLDNRRRLTAGVREGTEVTVRDVGVIEIGDPHEGVADHGGFSYDVVWSVVARVQHLQHVHHRKNTYGGVLTLQPMDNRWMLSGVELLSEDRVVVPWEPTG